MTTTNLERVTARKAELAARKAARISGYDVGYASQRIRLIGEDLKKKILSTMISVEIKEGYKRGVEDANVDHAVSQLLKEMKKS